MTYNSDNHDYEIPESNEANWDIPLQNLLEEIDNELILKGLPSDRPSAPESDTWFLDTQNNVLEHYNGNNWSIIGGRGSSSKPLPSVEADKVTTEDLNNAQWVPPAEDAQGIRDRLSTGATVALHPGATYLTETAGVDLPDDATLYLNGATIKPADGTTPSYKIVAFNGTQGATVVGGTIDGNRANTTDPGTHQQGVCVSFNSGAADNTVKNLELTSPWYRNLISYQSENNTIENITFRDLASGRAVELDHGTQGTTLDGATIYGEDQTADGVIIDQTADATTDNLVKNVTAYNCARAFAGSGHGGRNNRFVDCSAINPDRGIRVPNFGSAEKITIQNPSTWAFRLKTGAKLKDLTLIACFTGAADVFGDGAVLDGADVYGGFGTIRVKADEVTVSDVVGHSVNGDLVVNESGYSGTQLVDIRESNKTTSTSAANAAASGDDTLDVNSHVFDPGQRIDVTLDDGSTQTTFIIEILDDGTNGSANTLKLRDTLNDSVASGNSVSPSSTPGGVVDNGTDSLIDGCYTIGGVDTSSATNPTTGTNI